MKKQYDSPRVLRTDRLEPRHQLELQASAVDVITAGLSGVLSIGHGGAYDMGIRGDGDLRGLCFRYWEPWDSRFSDRFVRIKPDQSVAGRKYLQPVGEKPKLYFVAGTMPEDLANSLLSVFVVEGEKKTLSLHRALRTLEVPAVVVGIGGVWSWRHSPKELKPDGKLGKGRSRAIEELDRIQWASRKVILGFDSDVSTNWRVQAAETALAAELARRGAKVHILRIRGGGSWPKSA